MTLKTHCKHGHELAGNNLYVSPKGIRSCRKCRRGHAQSSHERNLDSKRKYAREWAQRKRAENPGRFKDYNLRSDYGISLAEYNEKLNYQNQRCMICERVMASPYVDHDHETQQVRDLLCRECNSALGFIREDVKIAEAIVGYLRRWKLSNKE